MKTIFIIIDRTEKFEQILKYSKTINKENEKYFIICAKDITPQIKSDFSEENCTFFRNTLPARYLNSIEPAYANSSANAIYASMLFATKILEKNMDFSSNIVLFTQIQNRDHIESFKYLFNWYDKVKYLYTRY